MTVKELKELLESLREEDQILFLDIQDWKYYKMYELGARATSRGQEYFIWGEKE